MSMTAKNLAALQKLRERLEDRARKELDARRRAEETPRTKALQAKDEMLNEVAARQAMSDRWKGSGKAPSSAADQITGRVLLARKDGEVARSVQVAAVAAEVLVRAVTATAESAEKLRAAHAASEKSRHGADRHREMAAMHKLKKDEAELDDETEVQVMARFAKPRAGAHHE